MSIARRIMGAREVRPAATPAEERVLTSLAAIPRPTDWLGGDTYVAPVNPTTAMRNMTVYGCVRLLADTIATLPWHVYTEDAAGFPQRLRPTPKVIASPLPGLTCWEWRWMNVWSLAMRGNAYNYVTARDYLQRPSSLFPLNPDSVRVEVPADSDTNDWVQPVYRVGGEVIDPSDIVHIRRYPTSGTPESLSPIAMAAATIGFAINAEEYGFRFFKDSAMPSGVLSSAQVGLPPELVGRVQKEWIRTHGGRRLPAVLEGGFQWQAVSITPEESQFLETRGFQDQQIMRMYGIPPHMLGDAKGATSWGTGIEQMGIGFVAFTLNPWLSCYEEKMTADTLPRGQYVNFDVDALQRGDAKARWDANFKAWQMGAKNTDEIRAGEGQPPIPALPENPTPGQVHMMPANMVPLGHVPEPPAAPAAPPPDETESGDDEGNNDDDEDANDEEATDDEDA